MNFKKYIPDTTLAIKIIIVVVVAGAIGVIAKGQGWVQKVTGRF